MEELTAIIIKALSDLFDVPVTGEITQNIWRALDLDSAGVAIMGFLTEKAKLTLNDGKLHSRSIEIQGDPSIGVSFMTWPNAREEVRHLARDHFLHAARVLTERYKIQGVLQFDLYLPAGKRAEMRIAWLPTAEPLESLPEALRSPLFPWGGGSASMAAAEPIRPGGNDLVELASAAWELHAAMGERLRLWPAASKSAALGLGEVHTRFETIVPRFNAASRRLELGHVMPVSRFDETWLPHNLANEQRFGSLAASLKADLARVWGAEAREAFGQLWDLFAKAHPNQPSDEDIVPFRKAPLQRKPVVHAELPPQGCEIFISYAWSDKTRGVRDIYELFRGSRRSVWLDEEQHPADKQLDEEIAAAMLQAKCIVICLSREMLTRGGYALREVLLALSHIPERCVLVRLDRIAAPPTLQSLRSVAWFEPDGAEQLEAVVVSILQSESSTAAPKELAFGGPIISGLAGALPSSKKSRRKIQTKGRRREIQLRAELLDLTHNAIALANAGEFEAVAKLASEARKVLRWSALRGRAVARDTTVFLPALRARCAIFRAHVQLGSGERFEFHNAAAFQLLDEIADIDLDLLRPVPRLGLLSGDCRIAVQDCLDGFHFAEEWFRGWPPSLLIDLPGVSMERALSIVRRMEARRDQLAERMFALRAIDELAVSPDPASSWSDTWKTMKDRLGKIQSGSHPFTIAYLQELNKTISEAMRSELAVVLADGAIECFFEGGYREEVHFDPADFRLRVVVRCYRAEASKHEMLASVRGTVFHDLLGPGSEGADLNVLYSAFFVPAKASGEFDYELYINCLPPLDGVVSERLPDTLTNPFVTMEMLSENELARISGDRYRTVRDEFD
jgi:hypothetical protein